MCGIAGIVAAHPAAEVRRSDIQPMCDAIRHRGPDGEGFFISKGVALGHRRLSIIDLEGGQQPMTSASGDLTIVFNGEIYNFDEIRRELSGKGARFRTHSDTEVLLEAWDYWGEQCLDRLVGMYAFAIWSERRQQLWLVRDRFGIKPLYFSVSDNFTVSFASELKGLRACRYFQRGSTDSTALLDYLTLGYIPPGKSIYSNAKQLRPGELVTFSRPTMSSVEKRYWLPVLRDSERRSAADSLENVSTRISDAVRRQLVADVPVASFLSGGIDSSVVTASMASAYGEKPVAYSVGVDDPKFNELQFARQVAGITGVTLKERQVSINDASRLEDVVQMYDEPFADSSSIPTIALCEYVSASHKVALSGDGGDEVFAGYPWYFSFVRRARRQSSPFGATAQRLSGAMAGCLDGIRPYVGSIRGYGRLAIAAQDAVGGFVAAQSIVGPYDYKSLLSPHCLQGLEGYQVSDQFHEIARNSGLNDPLALARYLDLQMYLPGDILTKVDRASMSCSLEVRVPLLDDRLFEFASGLPSSQIAPDMAPKRLLKDVCAGLVPGYDVDRPKQGFSIPVDKWFDGSLGDEFVHLLNDCGSEIVSEHLELSRVKDLLWQHRRGRRRMGPLLWAINCLVLAFRKSV